ARSTHHRNPLKKASAHFARDRSSGYVEIHIVCHHQTQSPVAVVVDKSATRAPCLARSGYACLFGYFGEHAVVVMIKTVFPVIRNVEILPAIVVVIPHASALAPSRCHQSGSYRDI